MNTKKWKQGIYTILNRSKYIGSKDPAYKSSLEERMMSYCDRNSKVLKWSYEPENFRIPYYNPLDRNYHEYFPDFFLEAIGTTGVTKKVLVEVKVIKEVPMDYLQEKYGYKLNEETLQKRLLKEPKKKSGKAKENFNSKRLIVLKNKAKFDAAKEFCKKKGFEFSIITEFDELNF